MDHAIFAAEQDYLFFRDVDHIRTRNTAFTVDTIRTRASLLGVSNVLCEAALDPYLFLRDAYL